MTRETIVAAAILVPVDDKFLTKTHNGARCYPDALIVSSPPPARHHTLLHPMVTALGHGIGPDQQGFVTSTGRYVGREEALWIALESGQPMIDHPARHDRLLFSEDLW